MGKTQLCRICRTEKNLKYTRKELRQLNKKQLLLAQATLQGQANNRASKKLLLTTPTLGNICKICDERIQIFHRLDDGGQESSSDVEIDVVSSINPTLPIRLVGNLPNGESLHRTQRPETPVIVDDDDMLFNIFMQKFDQKTQISRHRNSPSFSQQQLDKQITNQFHSTYTPPQSTGGCSEGDETKVIEVLTSRENTPTPMQSLPTITSNSNMVDSKGHRIVAIIELDDVDENCQESERINCTEKQKVQHTPVAKDLSLHNENVDHMSVVLPPTNNSNTKCLTMDETCQKDVEEDEDDIVFCKVDNETEKIPASKKGKRKSYDEKQLRLVASLNLVSSDSESEDSPLKIQVDTMPTIAVAEASKLLVNKNFSCNSQLKSPDSESLSVHERVHQDVKCILCTMGFQQDKRLIHHMRRKHREYNGDVLSEKPRSAQDSCMTIRLRYMQRSTFYECQLCGRIDDVFREHKEHIIEKHPNESKSLRDPMMKQLKCPVCKAKCGAQYLALCRHLLSSHEYQEYKSHLRELVHVSAFGWNAARQQEVSKTAKIFQFIKRKTFFFECRMCSKVVAGYLHHLRHVSGHQKTENNEKTKILPFKTSSTVVALDTSNLEKLCKGLKKDGTCISNILKNKDPLPNKLKNRNKLENDREDFQKASKISNKTQKPEVNDVQKSKFKTYKREKVKKSMRTVQSKNSEGDTKNESSKKLQVKNKCKPKDKEVVKLSKCAKLTKGNPKKETRKKDTKFKEKSAKAKDMQLKPQVKKIKVKTLIRQIDLQKYKCKYCSKKFKGFYLYNLHLLRQHKEDEYTKCKNCNKLYSSSPNFEEHVKQCPKISFSSKQKRKLSEQSDTSQLCVKKVPKKNHVSSGILEYNHLWLKELKKLKEPQNINDSNIFFHTSPKTALFYFQCCYCLHLFANDEDLKEHKELNHHHNPDILIRYKPIQKQPNE